MQVTQGLQMPFSDFTRGNLHLDRALEKKGKQIHPWAFATNKMCLVPTRVSDLIKPSPQKNTFVSLGTAGNSRFRTRAATGGKSAKPFRAPLPLPSSCPSGRPWSPRQARAAPGELSRVVGTPHPSPPSSGKRHTLEHPHPHPGQHAAGMKVQRSLGGGGCLHPQGLLFLREERVSFICRGHQGWGWGWWTARVCKPIRGGWGPELLAAAGEGHQTGSPRAAAPTSQVEAV